jgi:hypothetical protein
MEAIMQKAAAQTPDMIHPREAKIQDRLVVEGGNSLAGYAKRFEAASVTGIGRGGLDAKDVLAWAAVGIPLSWGF